MSVYTPVTTAELESWLARYALGELDTLEPIRAGIENTNYFVITSKGRFVLTLYERLPAEDLPFYLNFMAHLSREGVEVPAPQADRTGALFSMLNGKPAGLVTRVDGAPVEVPTVSQCGAIGAALGRLHVASLGYRARHENQRGPAWWRQAARAVRPHLSPRQDELLQQELAFQASFAMLKLPRAAIHADLFCDNALFVGDRVAGIIDFGFAATEYLAYDVAITINDWCDAGDGSLDYVRMDALLEHYDSVRPFSPDENEHLVMLLRAAALRFWLSRLYDLHLPRAGELVHAHDPLRFERILCHRVTMSNKSRQRARAK
ncbi:MAG TPA: homoserine kinase [Casimicrobiaceae bacterium]|nr:homoserine kinase [Casimicrobiaceae bacterium]